MNTQVTNIKNCDHCMMDNVCKHTSISSNIGQNQQPVVQRTHQLKRKELLYSYRDPFKSIYAVNAGAIKTFNIDLNGEERIQNFYLPGEIIGLEGIQSGFYPFSAIALVPSEICEIAFDNLKDIISAKSCLQQQIFSILGFRINLAQYVTAPHAEQRFAAFILDMAKRLNHQSATEFELPMSRYDIGNHLGLASETISRLFTRFQQAELLHAQQKKISLLNMQKLQWIAHDGMAAI